MPQFDRRTLHSISDEDLLALELDKDLPIEEWMAVERERGRREEKRRREAERANATPPAATAAVRREEHEEDYRVRDALVQLRALLVPGETIGAYAVQRRLFALTHRRLIVCATSGRFISLARGVFGGYTPHDVRWQDLDDASITAGIFGATLTITALDSPDLASRGGAAGRTVRIDGLRKDQAQKVYTICQAQEQAWREKRRVRDLDELRAQSGGVNIGGGLGGVAANVAAAGGDPGERLRKAKQMLDDGLITDAEYETIKARVVDGL